MRIALLHETKPDTLPEGAPSDLYMELENIEDVEHITLSLEQLGHTVFPVNSLHDPLPRLLDIRGRVELVFNYSVGFGMRSREVIGPAICELLGIPFTGSDAMALALASDKHTTKLHAVDVGVATPEWHHVRSLADLDAAGLPSYPVIVKPTYEGSSIGVRGPIPPGTPRVLRDTVSEILDTYSQPVLVERFIPGYEVTVPVVGGSPVALHPVALHIGGDVELGTIFGAATKAEKEGHGWTSELPITPAVRDLVAEWACTIHNRLGCRDFSRSDFRITPSGEPYFLEINPTSQLTDSFTAAARAKGRDLSWVLEEILESARSRWGI